MNKTMRKPKAVCISDVHYRLETLQLAEAAMSDAIRYASELQVPLFILGDLHDTKALLRGEVVNSLIVRLADAKHVGVRVSVLIGNHDMINEKGGEHSLNFLKPWVHIIDHTQRVGDMTFIPYQPTPEAFAEELRHAKPGSMIFMHQGVKGADMGDYVMDHSAIDAELLKNHVVFSGHYHKHHTVNTVTYLGSPYTITAAEANDGPKGFLLVYDDGSFEQIPTNLRKHVTVERTTATVLDPIPGLNPEDKLWLKVSGPYSELERLDKQLIGVNHLGHANFKLDKIVTESVVQVEAPQAATPQVPADMLDAIIDASPESQEQKAFLKKLWREIA